MQVFFCFLMCLGLLLEAKRVDTFYGPFEVEESVLIELIESVPFQRLKHIHQYGVAYYTTHQEEYSRYDHSLGVFAILREKKASLKEQIAGLLHDVSHTVFSHVGDWVFLKENQEKDYQNTIHKRFLEESSLGEILQRYGFEVQDVLPLEELFPALEQGRPNLCADRIDYNIQGAYYQGFINKEEALEIFKDLEFVDGNWVASNPVLIEKIADFSVFMTSDCWGSACNSISSRLLADAILRALEMNLIDMHQVHFGTDEEVWNLLIHSKDPEIENKMNRLLLVEKTFELTVPEQADLVIRSAFRGIDPWIKTENGKIRLTQLRVDFAERYKKTKCQVETGWPVRFIF